MVRVGRFELPLRKLNQILNLARLPIPPHPQINDLLNFLRIRIYLYLKSEYTLFKINHEKNYYRLYL